MKTYIELLPRLLARPAVILGSVVILGSAHANNIAVSGMSLTNIVTASHVLDAMFNVSWDNSWFLSPANSPGNYDAAWLVIKYHTGDNIWRTATLDPNPANHAIPSGFAITVATNSNPTRAVGVFLHRTSGNGTSTVNGVSLHWLYGQDGVADSALITAEIHAVEMVYVPSNSFTVGDGTTASYFRTGTNTTPFTITSPGAINAGTNNGFLRVGAANNNTNYTIPATFPNGVNSFYIMKYEVSQDQYLDFLNKTLAGASSTSGFQTDRQATAGTTPNFVTPTPYHSALDQGYFNSYLSFICLRPMTEFEYEKACRGPNTPVAGEYAWGTSVAATLQYGLSNDGSATEAVGTNYNETAGNCWYLETQRTALTGGTNYGPCRVGMFAKTTYNGTTSSRIQSGAGYYGAMDLTGNGLERVILAPQSATDNGALNFIGENGTGLASAPPSSWVGLIPGGRGGSARFRDPLTHVEVTQSGAISPVSVSLQGGSANYSGAIRGVRSSP
jgi:hypothetical protein